MNSNEASSQPAAARLPSASRGGLVPLIGAQTGGMVSAFLLTILLARELGPSSYGAFAFFVAAAGIVALFTELGIFTATARLIVRAEEPHRSQLIGAAVAILAATAVVFSALMAALALTVDPVFGLDARKAILIAAPVSGGLALDVATLYLAQGTGRYDLLGARNLFGRGIPLVIVGLCVVFGLNVSLELATFTYAAGSTITTAAVIAAMRPRFMHVRRQIELIRDELRRGKDFGIFLGRTLGTATYNLDRIFVAYFLTAADVSYYALAFAFAAPVQLLAQALASMAFADLSVSTTIARRLQLRNLALLLPAAAAAYVAVDFGLPHLLPQYTSMLSIFPIALTTAVVMGILQLPNQFLIAHGRGNDLRAAGIVFAAVNVLANVTLIPLLGLAGAAWASLICTCVMLVVLWQRYRAYVSAVVPSVAAG